MKKALCAIVFAGLASVVVAEPYRTYLDEKGPGSCGAVLIGQRDGGIMCGIKGWYWRSDDGGRIWTKLYKYTKGAGTNLLRLKSGRILVSFSLHPNELMQDLKNFEGVGWVNAFCSDDEGRVGAAALPVATSAFCIKTVCCL